MCTSVVFAAVEDTPNDTTTEYNVTCQETNHGAVTIGDEEQTEAHFIAGETVSLNVTAEDGYELSKLNIVNAENKKSEATGLHSDSFSFVMPEFDVLVKSSFSKISAKEAEEAKLAAEAAEETEKCAEEDGVDYQVEVLICYVDDGGDADSPCTGIAKLHPQSTVMDDEVSVVINRYPNSYQYDYFAGWPKVYSMFSSPIQEEVAGYSYNAQTGTMTIPRNAFSEQHLTIKVIMPISDPSYDIIHGVGYVRTEEEAYTDYGSGSLDEDGTVALNLSSVKAEGKYAEETDKNGSIVSLSTIMPLAKADVDEIEIGGESLEVGKKYQIKDATLWNMMGTVYNPYLWNRYFCFNMDQYYTTGSYGFCAMDIEVDNDILGDFDTIGRKKSEMPNGVSYNVMNEDGVAYSEWKGEKWNTHYFVWGDCCENVNNTTSGEPVFVKSGSYVRPDSIVQKSDGTYKIECYYYIQANGPYGNNFQDVSGVFSLETIPATGYVKIEKVSSNTDLTDDIPCYSYKGAEFGIYSDERCRDQDEVETLKTNANGKTPKLELEIGETYYVKEISAPKGFSLNDTVKSFTLTSKSIQTIKIIEYKDVPYKDLNLKITKKDANGTSDDYLSSDSNISLEGAQFTVKYYNDYYSKVSDLPSKATRTWVIKTIQNDGKYVATLDKEHKVSGDDFYLTTNGNVAIPLGTITVEETKAPKGFEKGTVTHTESGKNGQIVLTKITDDVADEDNATVDISLAYTAGDEEIITLNTKASNTDDGTQLGYASGEQEFSDAITYTGFVKGTTYDVKTYGWLEDGTAITNAAGEEVLDETSVTPSSNSESRGTVTNTFELKCDAYEGKTVTFGTVVYVDGKEVATHKDLTDTKQQIHFPKIETTATEEEYGTHYEYADEDIVIVDEVKYSNLVAGLEYTMNGTLMDKETGEPALDDDGNEITATTTFTPENSSGTVELRFVFSGVIQTGQITVAYEDMQYKEKTYAVHADLDDEGQTVYYPEVVSLAADSVGGDTSLAEEDDVIYVQLGYKNLDNGEQYSFSVVAVDPETGEVYTDADGNQIKFEAEFTATDNEYFDEITEGVLIPGVKDRAVILGNDDPDNTDDSEDAETPDDADDSENIETPDDADDSNVTESPDDSKDSSQLETSDEDDSNIDEIKVDMGQYLVATLNFDSTEFAGKDIVFFDTIYRSNGAVLARHADVNDEYQTIHFPEIGTTATDVESGTHMSNADDEISIVDRIEYHNLVAGRTYTVTGILMDQETGEAMLDDEGDEIIAECEFVAEDSDGFVEITFIFPGVSLDGRTVVAFEDLYDDGVKVAVHADLEDENQTVHIPKLHTTALDAENETHYSYADDEITITDRVRIDNILEGVEYTVSGVLVDLETGEPILDDNGQEITAEETFTFGDILDEDADNSDDETLKQSDDDADIDVEEIEDEEVVDEDVDDQDSNDKNVNDQDIDDEDVNDENADDEDVDNEQSSDTENMDEEEEIINDFIEEDPEALYVDITFTFSGTSLAGKTVVAFEELSLEDGSVIGEHKDLEDKGQTIYFPEIGTTALDMESESHMSNADGDITIVDTVAYTNLIPGETYKLTAELIDKESGNVLQDDSGNVITGETEFVPVEESGFEDVTFTFSGEQLVGKTGVAFETLTMGEFDMASHLDLEDEDQTIYFPELKTSASDQEDGDKNIVADGTVTIVDTVTYTNLIPGTEYKVSGVLMDPSTNSELLVDGSSVTGETTFTADDKTGTAQVEFTFNAAGVTSSKLVVFEKLYLADNGAEIASHEDINDQEQTITIEQPTDENNNSSNPSDPKGGSGGSSNPGSEGTGSSVTPRTGDSRPISLAIMIAIIAAIIGGIGYAMNRKKKA